MKREVIDRCPKCRSRDGYRYVLRLEMEGDWGEAAETNDEYQAPKMVTCRACGFRVARSRADESVRR